MLEIHFSQLFSNIAYFKACFKVPKIQLPFFILTPTITVQINSNLTLARMSLAETQLIFKFTHDLVASAQMWLG